MTILTGVSGHFSAAHRSTDGVLHGHTWQVMAWFRTPGKADAACYKASLDSLLRSWDHSELPEHLSWAEGIAAAVGRLVNCVEVVVSRPLEGYHARWLAAPQGIEAGTAETQSGSVHESPVGHQADAPETTGLTFSREVDEVREADERAKIVAWLRKRQEIHRSKWAVSIDTATRDIADAIERGDHLSTIEEPRG